MKAFILYLFLFSTYLFADSSRINITQVLVDCGETEACNEKRQRFTNLIGEYRSLNHFKEILRILSADGGYRQITYDLMKEDDHFKLFLKMILKPTIKEINIGTIDRNVDTDLAQFLSLREGDFFDAQKLKQDLQILQEKIELLGYPENTFEMNVREINESASIYISIKLGNPIIFKKINPDSKSRFINDYLRRKFLVLYNRPFDSSKFKLYLDEAQKELFNYGYYLISLESYPRITKRRVLLDIKVTQDRSFTFDFKNLQSDHRLNLHNLMKDLFRKYKRSLSEALIKSSLEEYYQAKALLNADIKIETINYKNNFNENVTSYKIFLNEKNKTRISQVNFSGFNFFSRKKLDNFFHSEGFELSKAGYYDLEYFNYFSGYLKSKYYENGFVQAKVIGPTLKLDQEKKSVNVDYFIQEGQRTFVRSIVFEGMPPELEQVVSQAISNKVGQPFNPVLLLDDLKKVTNELQERGYYFAEVTNANNETLVLFSKNASDVDIRFTVQTGPLLRLNRVIYLGNIKTRKEVLSKKILIDRGDIITPSQTKDFETSLSSTGLFNSVSVTPMRTNLLSRASTDLIVKVSERDYGLVEFAPGFRTDLGAKVTTTASYVNIGGLNRSLTLRSQVNQRLNYQTFDPRRRKERRQIVEHNETLTYTQGDIFNTQISSSTGAAYQIKRFYSFDAEILRLNNTFSRDFSSRFSTSLRYQYEAITQSDATEEKDNGSFKVGAFTPSLTYDLRNSPVNPVKGSFLNLSCEFANPYFLSQRESDLTINYYKLVTRNRFYIPFKNGTLALSMVAGVQENLANEKSTVNGVTTTDGYIPNIKVFRLTGMDIVRGFNDEEINRVPGDSRDDISEVKVDQRAYLANFKIEPRYFINDSLMAGVFYDAGRVFVNQVDMGQLRDSVGLTFKVLTPVGSLDFDYGIKLLRERNKNGTLEDPGRFHVSIGFF